MLRKSLLVTAISAALTGQALAGGFYLTLGQPSASSDPKAKSAILTVRPDGCHEPAKAVVSGMAVGIVNGKRQTVPLTLVPLTQPATYALMREWGAEGTWVLSLVATLDGHATSAVVPIGAKGFERASVKYFRRAPTQGEIESALNGKLLAAK